MVNYRSADPFYQGLADIEGEIDDLMDYIQNNKLDNNYNKYFLKKLEQKNFQEKINLLSKALDVRIKDEIKIK